MNQFLPSQQTNTEGGALTASQKIQQSMEMAIARQAKEVEAQALMAKKFPRDESQALDRILAACSRRSMAEIACYEFTKGGQSISDGSVHLARMIAGYWGNITHGFAELSRDEVKGESHVMCYAWDVESNARECRVIVVPHYRDTKRGKVRLSNDRDIYEHVANMAARRVRECIFDVIPADVKDLAIEACNRTLMTGHERPLSERIGLMVNAFSEVGVTERMLAAKWGKPVRSFNERDMVRARKILASIKDGLAQVSEFFDEESSIADAEATSGATTKTEQLEKKVAGTKKKATTGKKRGRPRKKKEPELPPYDKEFETAQLEKTAKPKDPEPAPPTSDPLKEMESFVADEGEATPPETVNDEVPF